jgi:hypothetical protein
MGFSGAFCHIFHSMSLRQQQQQKHTTTKDSAADSTRVLGLCA